MESTILGPYGEGYCTACRFIVGLDEKGRLERHGRMVAGSNTRTLCKGSNRKPPRRLPYASRLSVFRVNAKPGKCPVCCRRIRLESDGTLSAHGMTAFTLSLCPGTSKRPR